MLALDPVVVDAVWASFAAYLPEHGESNHPLGCHRPGFLTETASKRSSSASSPGAHGMWPDGSARGARRRFGVDVTSGWPSVRVSTWSKKQSTRSTR